MVCLWLNKSVVLQLGDSILGLESKGQSPPNYLLTDAAFLIKSRNYKYDVSVFGCFRNSTFQERERTPARHIFCLWFSCFNTSWENWQPADTPQLWVPFVYTVRLLQFEFTSNIKNIKAA